MVVGYVDGRLMRSWQGGRARHLAVAADHAWLAEACVRISEWSGRAAGEPGPAWSPTSSSPSSADAESGGFYTTGSDAEALVVRPMESLDGALPASNSIAVTALLRVQALADDPRLDDAVEAPSPWPGRCSSGIPGRSPTSSPRSRCGAVVTRSW